MRMCQTRPPGFIVLPDKLIKGLLRNNRESLIENDQIYIVIITARVFNNFENH